MHYDYRSHETSHAGKGRKSVWQVKRPTQIALAVCVCFLLLIPAGYLIVIDRDKSNAPVDDMLLGDEAKPEDPKPYGNRIEAEAVVSGLHAPGELNPASLDPWELRLGSHLAKDVVTVSPGDTLVNILQARGLDRPDAYRAVNVIKDVFDPRKLRSGHTLHLSFDETGGSSEAVFQGLRLKLSAELEVQLINCPNKGFVARTHRLNLETRPVTAAARIDSSLYQAAMDEDLPIDILMQLIRMYSFDVDFQRDIRSGDKIRVLYEKKVDGDGVSVKPGAVLYASLHANGRYLPAYRHETGDGETDFFDAAGKSVRKTLMVTPIDGARISSGYGMRRHPIQGYNRMHRGLDFAAPTGTPVMAAGDGVVEYAGRNGSYGHYIRIRHPNEYHTVYAHLSRYARGVRSGTRVKQGQTIGYVGATGEATGPHLHYEVHHRGKHVNPATVKTPPGRTLKGEERKRFKIVKQGLETLYASLEGRTEVAGAPENHTVESGFLAAWSSPSPIIKSIERISK